MPQQTRKTHNNYQRHYYESFERPRIALSQSRYVNAHIERMIDAAKLSKKDSILEVGSGLGKFTLPLSANGFKITANDLSPQLLERLDAAAEGKIETVCCDIHDIASQHIDNVDAVIGFFVLHHLMDFSQLFRTLSTKLTPGGHIAFCEPVATNPLYYLQILLTPNMHFSGEPSLTSMRPGVILPAMTEAGFVHARAHSYGYFPPFIKNSKWGDQLEQRLNSSRFVPFPHAFQIFTARLPLSSQGHLNR